MTASGEAEAFGELLDFSKRRSRKSAPDQSSEIGLRHVVSPGGSETPYSWTGGPPRRERRHRKVDSPALDRATARFVGQLGKLRA